MNKNIELVLELTSKYNIKLSGQDLVTIISIYEKDDAKSIKNILSVVEKSPLVDLLKTKEVE